MWSWRSLLRIRRWSGALKIRVGGEVGIASVVVLSGHVCEIAVVCVPHALHRVTSWGFMAVMETKRCSVRIMCDDWLSGN